MNSRKQAPKTRPSTINLVSMPWALFNRPSIQLGTLKAFLESRHENISVVTSHPYLQVAAILGPDLYHWISQNPWVSEALYAPLVFPEQSDSAKALAMKYVRKADQTIKQSFDFELITGKLAIQLKGWIASCDWTQYALVGFSVCFHQLLASLAAAAAIKKKHPGIPIVLGGSSCAANAGKSLLKTFDFIDYIIEGEGENGLLALYLYILGSQKNNLPANIIRRHATKQAVSERQGRPDRSQFASLAELPVPDYQEYFAEQQKWFSHTPFIPILPVEFSRGCWWNKCSFCNLNLQWCGYRNKSAAVMMQEVKTLAFRHGCLDFTFVDNMLPEKESLQFFQMCQEQDADFSFFAEIRSAKSGRPSAEIFSIYRQGGLNTIQVGIEALSRSLLQKMHKGVRVIENIATMRAAIENKLKLTGNLILQFPGSSQAEVDETLETLDYVFPYSPLDLAAFFLGYGSPIYKKPKKYGIGAIVNHPNNTRLFPRSILTGITVLVNDYRGDRVYQRKIWQPVSEKVIQWQQYHEKRNQDALHNPLLYYRDGGDFLLIRQELPDGKVLHHRLRGISRRIYLYCTNIRRDRELFAEFPGVPAGKILAFLRDLQQKRILFSEKNKYLALAVHFSD